MKLLISYEDHLIRGPDNSIYGPGPVNYSMWSRNLEFFDEIVLLSRVRLTKSFASSTERVDGPCVSVYELPDFTGPAEYLRNLPVLRARTRQAVQSCDAYLLCIPGLVSHVAWGEIGRIGRPFAVEIWGDPWDAFSPGSVNGLLRPLYRRLLTRETKLICRQAQAVLYWTQEALQRRYPHGDDAYCVVSPTVVLRQGYATQEVIDERFCRIQKFCRAAKQDHDPLRVGFVGSLRQMYKGPDTLLHAVSLCLQRGLRLKVFLVGEGCYRVSMEALANKLGVREHVTFLGQLGYGKPISDFLDSMDLFLMPSRAEGFGRAMVEAMARGCPCIGSRISGIAELLALADSVPPGDATALADKIFEVATDPDRLKHMSQRNLERARQFSPESLRESRREFLRHLRTHAAACAEPRSEFAVSRAQ